MDRVLRTRARTRLLIAAASALFAACADGGEEPPPLLARPNLVLITIDTLRADHLGCYGYFRDTSPRIDALARESVVFDAAYATMATTLPSHASILTSRYPLEHGILANLMHGGRPFGWKQGMLSFAQVAQEAGYRTAGFVSSAPLKRQSGMHAGFDEWSEPEATNRIAGETLAEVLPWLAARPPEPFFLWVHLFDPHWPPSAPPAFAARFRSDGPDPGLEAWIAARRIPEAAVRNRTQILRANESTPTREALDAYCADVAYTDHEVGRLLDALREQGLLERSILALTADHGEGLNQHDWTGHGLVWDEQIRVPLLIRFPAAARQAPRRVRSIVSLIDLVPTLLGRIEPWGTPSWARYFEHASGLDVLAPGFAERAVCAQRSDKEIEDDPGEMFTVMTPEWKYVHQPEAGGLLFDRRKDAFELENLIEREPGEAERAQRLTMTLRDAQARRGALLGEAPAGEVDEGLLEELRALGYMGGEERASEPPGTPR